MMYINVVKFEFLELDQFWSGRTNFGCKNWPAGPNYVDQNWSGRTDFYPGPIFLLKGKTQKVSKIDMYAVTSYMCRKAKNTRLNNKHGKATRGRQ